MEVDDDHLSFDALVALNDVFSALFVDSGTSSFCEDWQLSQFWYNEETSQFLARAVLQAIQNQGKVACISCPTLFMKLRNIIQEENLADRITLALFEFDKRFSKFGHEFYFYDYREPYSVTQNFAQGSFDLVACDPPFLSEECFSLITKTVQYLQRSKILFCTGSVMEEYIDNHLYLKPCTTFKPQHSRKLGNDFRCFTNFPLVKRQVKIFKQ